MIHMQKLSKTSFKVLYVDAGAGGTSDDADAGGKEISTYVFNCCVSCG